MDTTIGTEARSSRRRRIDAAEIARPHPATSIPIEDISRRAYELFLERGGVHGADIDDWLRAEQELGGRIES